MGHTWVTEDGIHWDFTSLSSFFILTGKRQVEDHCAIGIDKKACLNGPVYLFFIFCQLPRDKGF